MLLSPSPDSRRWQASTILRSSAVASRATPHCMCELAAAGYLEVCVSGLDSEIQWPPVTRSAPHLHWASSSLSPSAEGRITLRFPSGSDPSDDTFPSSYFRFGANSMPKQQFGMNIYGIAEYE